MLSIASEVIKADGHKHIMMSLAYFIYKENRQSKEKCGVI
jgi:hypothetical protein